MGYYQLMPPTPGHEGVDTFAYVSDDGEVSPCGEFGIYHDYEDFADLDDAGVARAELELLGGVPVEEQRRRLLAAREGAGQGSRLPDWPERAERVGERLRQRHKQARERLWAAERARQETRLAKLSEDERRQAIQDTLAP